MYIELWAPWLASSSAGAYYCIAITSRPYQAFQISQWIHHASTSTSRDSIPQPAHHPVGNPTSKKLTSLSKDSSVSLTQVLVHPRNRVYLVSINSLWSSAFTTTGARAMNLQGILHPSTMPKVCFAVGESSGALFAHGDIVLGSIQDIQLVQYAARQRLQRSKRDRGRGSLEMYQTGWSDVCSRGTGLGAWAGRHTSKERGFGARSLTTGVWTRDLADFVCKMVRSCRGCGTCVCSILALVGGW